MAQPTVQGKLGFFYDGGVGDRWVHDGSGWVEYYPTVVPTTSFMVGMQVDSTTTASITVAIKGKELSYTEKIGAGVEGPRIPIAGGETVVIPVTAGGSNRITLYGGNVGEFRAEGNDNITEATIYKLGPLMTSMEKMFATNAGLVTVNINKYAIRTIRYAKMSFMSCPSLSGFNLVDPTDTGHIEDFSKMFYGCSDLLMVPVMNVEMGKDLSSMFEDSGVTDIPAALDLKKAENVSMLFKGCAAFNTTHTIKADNASNLYRMYYTCSALTSTPTVDFKDGADISGIYSGTVVVDIPTMTGEGLNAEDAFASTTAVTANHLHNFRCKNAKNMFHLNTSLETVEIDLVDTVNAFGMFSGCSKLLNVDPNINTSNIVDMGSMFVNCGILENAAPVRTDSAVSVSRMFEMCPKLVVPPDVIDLSFAKDTERMFGACTSLTYGPNIVNVVHTVSADVFELCNVLAIVPMVQAEPGKIPPTFFSLASLNYPTLAERPRIEAGETYYAPLSAMTPNKIDHELLHMTGTGSPIGALFAFEGCKYTDLADSQVYTYIDLDWVLGNGVGGGGAAAIDELTDASYTAADHALFLGDSAGQAGPTNAVGVGYNALNAATAGADTTALGYGAGSIATGSTDSVFIGSGAQPDDATAVNQIVIGKGATGLGDNMAVIGNASTLEVNLKGLGVAPDAEIADIMAAQAKVLITKEYLTAEIYKVTHPPAVSSLSYTGRIYYNRFDATVATPHLTWTELNGPTGLSISDNVGKMAAVAEAVVGDGFIDSAASYSKADSASISWTLSGDDGVSAATSIMFVFPSYFGVNSTGADPVFGEITAEAEILTNTASSITITPGNVATEYVWVAVPVTGSAFTKWFNVVGNDGNMGGGEAFELKTSTMLIHGVNYEVYMQSMPSAWNGTLKLF